MVEVLIERTKTGPYVKKNDGQKARPTTWLHRIPYFSRQVDAVSWP